MFRSIFMCALLAFTLSGCAFSNSVVRIDFKAPPVSVPPATSQPIAIEQLVDQRGADPLVLGNKGVQYKTSGLYTVETPVATIVTNAVRDIFAGMQYRIGGAGDRLVISGELLRLESEPVMGFWSGDLNGVIQVALKLTQRSDGALLWTETFTGNGKVTGLQVDHEGHRKAVIEMALGDLATKIAASGSLRQALQRSEAAPAAASP